MIGRVLLQILKVICLTVPVTWLWLEWGRAAYGRLFAQLAIPIFGFLGMTRVIPLGARDRFINYLPFLILMVVTPRMGWLRRVVGIVVGFVAIFFLQVFFVYMAEVVGVEGGEVNRQDVYEKMLPVMLLCDAFPFVLWIVIAKDFVREVTAKLFVQAGPRNG
ncbi:MAG: hypothetical protein GY944_00790 [bacterium]|nr:hypothetical protein [bacterium]